MGTSSAETILTASSEEANAPFVSALLKCAACTSQRWPFTAAGAVCVLDMERVNALLIDVCALSDSSAGSYECKVSFFRLENHSHDYRASFLLLFVCCNDGGGGKDANQWGCRGQEVFFILPWLL